MYVSYIDCVAYDPFFNFNGSIMINMRNGPWSLIRVFSVFFSLIFYKYQIFWFVRMSITQPLFIPVAVCFGESNNINFPFAERQQCPSVIESGVMSHNSIRRLVCMVRAYLLIG